MTDSIFTRDGSAWLPTSAARGPWGAALHGGAPAALLCHALEQSRAVAASRWRGSPWTCSVRCPWSRWRSRSGPCAPVAGCWSRRRS
ncbi:MAG: hypothetical protein U5R48_01860 [Gammaproteobacteria bacterium]|nr:hypothetical protein [Gammaproteobacteria bacterium]